MKRVVMAAVLPLMTVASVEAADWTEKVKVKGDLRYRHEATDSDGDATNARHRQCLRARIGIAAEVNEMTKIGVQLATGSDDPGSTNQTLDSAFSTKEIRLDLAYFTLSPKQTPSFSLSAGKIKNPFIKPGSSELLWDSDLNPEGGALVFEKALENVSLQTVGAGFWIDESSSGDDSWLGGGQGMVSFGLNEGETTVGVGAGFFKYVNSGGHSPFYDATDSYGNTLAMDSTYLNDYEILEIFGELRHDFNGIPITLAGDFIKNTAADSLETGWLVGTWIGKAKNSGTWELRYVYREIQADAQVGIFTDSDFRGGGTDAKGHEFGGGYAIATNMFLNATYFLNDLGTEVGDPETFQRFQIDLQLKY